MLRRVQIRNVQADVPGKDAVQYLGDHIRLGELERLQELPGRRHIRDRAPYRRKACRGRAREICGRAVPRVKWCYLTAVLEPDDRPCPGRAGLFIRESWRPPQSRVPMEELVEAADPRI